MKRAEGRRRANASTPASRFKLYTGAILGNLGAMKTGEIPQVGVFAAGNAENFTRVLKALVCFSGATNDAAPRSWAFSLTRNTSSDALSAANDPLILEVETANRRNIEIAQNIAHA